MPDVRIRDRRGDTLNLKEFAAAVARYRWTALLTAAAVLAIGLTAILLLPHKYVSTTQLMVSIEGSTTANAYQNDEVVVGRVNSYIELLRSGVVAQRVIDKLGLPLSTSEFAAKINATNVPPKTAIIDVAVTDESPARAQQLADTLASEFISYTAALETPTGEDGQKVHTTVVTAAGAAHERRAELAFLGLLAVAAAVLLACVAVWVRARTDPVIRSSDQAALAIDAPVIGCVTAGPATAKDLEGYRRLRTRLRSIMNTMQKSERGDVVVLASTADELDTKSVASNLGRAMELAGSRSTVLDARFPQSEPAYEPPDHDGAQSRDEVQRVGPNVDNNADANPGTPVTVSGTTLELTRSESRAGGRPDTLIDELRSRYETVLVAAPGVLSSAAASALADHADAVLLVLSPGTTKRRDVTRAAADLRAIGAPLIGAVLRQTQ